VEAGSNELPSRNFAKRISTGFAGFDFRLLFKNQQKTKA
jgi:hypothetical protein